LSNDDVHADVLLNRPWTQRRSRPTSKTYHHCGDGIHRGLLDSSPRDPRGPWPRRGARQCASGERTSSAARPMSWTPSGCRSCTALGCSEVASDRPPRSRPCGPICGTSRPWCRAPRRTCSACRRPPPDEPPALHRDQRHHRRHRAAHRPRHRPGADGPSGLRAASGCPVSGVGGNHRPHYATRTMLKSRGKHKQQFSPVTAQPRPRHRRKTNSAADSFSAGSGNHDSDRDLPGRCCTVSERGIQCHAERRCRPWRHGRT